MDGLACLVGDPTTAQSRSWPIAATDARCRNCRDRSGLTCQRSSPLSGSDPCSG